MGSSKRQFSLVPRNCGLAGSQTKLTGKSKDIMFNQTSFSASCANAWTPDEGILEHHTHLGSARRHDCRSYKTALIPIVASIVPIPIQLSSTAGSPCLPMARSNDSMKT